MPFWGPHFTLHGQLMSITRESDSRMLTMIGDVNTERPGMFDLKGKAQWDAWNANKGKSQEDAEKEYIALVRYDSCALLTPV